MKRYKAILVALFSFVLLSAALSRAHSQTIQVAVAANAQFVAQALKKAFEKKRQAKIELIVSSSGKITAQIMHGAPYDVFLSADMKYPEHLYKAGFGLDSPKIYACGSLVLWTLKQVDLADGLDMLKSASIKAIAVANPELAPYGAATIQALKKKGVYDAIKDKIVFGESISQVNQYLLSGTADVAFTAKSVVKAPGLTGKGVWTAIPDALYSPIRQGVIILKHAKQSGPEAAQSFYQFLTSAEGKAIFNAYGYAIK